MRTVIMIFFFALALTTTSTPWMRRFAIRLGFLDLPSVRKAHASPVPLLGGVAILVGAALAFFLVFLEFNLTSRIVGVLVAAPLMFAIGLIDDRRGLPAWLKLGSQCAAALLLACFDVRVQLPFPEAVNYLISVAWLVGISNAMNFLDNMDGLCAGVSGVAAAFIILMAASNNQGLVAALAAAVLGACLGFLRHNLRPANIFMGDAGSLFLGFLLAILALLLRFPDNVTFVTWMVPVFILGLPIFDTTLVVICRIQRGANPFTTAGKDHLSHRLVEMGLGQREALLLLYLIAGVFGMVGLFITRADVVEGYAIAAMMALLGLYAILWLEKNRPSAIVLN